MGEFDFRTFIHALDQGNLEWNFLLFTTLNRRNGELLPACWASDEADFLEN